MLEEDKSTVIRKALREGRADLPHDGRTSSAGRRVDRGRRGVRCPTGTRRRISTMGSEITRRRSETEGPGRLGGQLRNRAPAQPGRRRRDRLAHPRLDRPRITPTVGSACCRVRGHGVYSPRFSSFSPSWEAARTFRSTPRTSNLGRWSVKQDGSTASGSLDATGGGWKWAFPGTSYAPP